MADSFDTTLGGADRRFPDTTWQIVTRLHATGDAEYRAGMELLCRRYWKPIYTWVRIACARSNEDAKDLTQAFLLWLVGGDALRRYVPEKGSFRGYIKLLLKRFVQDQADAMNALKRGGGVKVVPLESLEEFEPDPRAADPEKAFDRAWAVGIAKDAVERVRERFKARGREIQFRAYEAYDLSPPAEKPTYAKIAEQLRIGESDVRNHLFTVRREIQEEIRAEIARTVGNPSELEEEWNALFGS
ncbi:MAG: sigma-70 family RNA polymerase sigma factor [Planctomycetes bacterium]|nr:sigma-70 family RNA polymerase sigma factor [Planctomycetota bacterium]